MDDPELTPPEPELPDTPEGLVAGNVRRLRKAFSLTQEELAELATKAGHDLGVMAIWSLENGKRRIRVDDLYGLAAAFDIPVRQLLSTEVEPVASERTYGVMVDGGSTEVVTADLVETDEDGWLNFYLHGRRVFFAYKSRVLCVRAGGTR